MAFSAPEVVIAHRNFSVTFPPIELKAGEILGIFGKSGAGKTSYMKRIREICDPHDVHYMSQFDGLFEEISIRQNIELGLAATGASGPEAERWEEAHKNVLHDFEVDRHLAKYPRAMSGGQRKRAEIVRSLIMNPKVLLLDEPFNGIGHLFESVCTREILRRGKESEGVTMVVSHDFDLLSAFCDRVMLVDDRGVIGFVPVKEKDWHPTDVRTAWTLAVDSVIPASALPKLHTQGLPAVSSDGFLGFWGRSAVWGSQAAAAIRIAKNDIVNMRHSLKQGMKYTHIEVSLDGFEHPVLLTGRGLIDPSEEVTLGIEECWALSA